ncbi:MAG: DNA mismatch repair protein MutS, partial [Spirochaetaceae bacterium]|nr:DNA mismatch repair protein MutS [Spirochaetaceae bacterium]
LFQVAKEIAYTDCIASLAQAAVTNQWVPPEISEEGPLEIVAGRHPVVEQHLPSGEFVPNDGYFSQDKYFALITGPNMAGKSTYLRQTALITLLAQTGSFVPARSARIPLVDKIFCRVGASDNLARGESTFLVEMTETAHILRSATEKSLVIMDEVGRGTSTEDGLSIAWAVSEYLLNNIRCITLFATHYHELTRLVHPALLPLCLEVLEQEGEITFLKKIKEGSVANSYGIHVAQLAGVPQEVIHRAEVLLQEITQKVKGSTVIPDSVVEAVAPVESPVVLESQKNQSEFQSPGLFSDEELILDEILSTDTDNLAPIEALLRIARWKKALSGK